MLDLYFDCIDKFDLYLINRFSDEDAVFEVRNNVELIREVMENEVRRVFNIA
jgi:hypothetical protein